MKKNTKEQLVAKVLNSLTDEEKQQVLQWALQAKKVQSNTTLSVRKRYSQLKVIETKPPVKNILTRLLRAVKTKTWDQRSWPTRLGVGGLVFGLTAFTGKAIGIAGFGAGVGVSVSIVLGFGGTFLGLIISHLENEKKARDVPISPRGFEK